MKTYKEMTENILAKAKTETKKRAKKRRVLISGLSVGLAAVLGINLYLFVPYTTGSYTDVSAYKDSEYYTVIEKLNDVVNPDTRVTKNNFERWSDYFGRGFGAEAPDSSSDGFGTAQSPNAAPDASDPNGEAPGDRYEEVTDNQVNGVTEGDLFKRSTDTVFYLGRRESNRYYQDDLTLRAYPITGEDADPLSELVIPAEENILFDAYYGEREMFLSTDLKTITVLCPCFNSATQKHYTAIISIDSENPAAMSVKSVQYLSGAYVSSRVQEGALLIINNFTVYRNPDFWDETQFLPQVGPNNALKSLPLDDIFLPETVTRANYTVLATFEEESGALIDAQALLSFSEEAYVAKDNIYVTNGYSSSFEFTYLSAHDNKTLITDTYSKAVTEITRVAYDAGMLTVEAEATLEGTVDDRYSMDEFEGHFRVFVTAPDIPTKNANGLWGGYSGTSASLYVLDSATMQTVAGVERFAPARDSVQSARFNGNTAYVCTAEIVMLTDPVYAFDLSDLAHITYKDTGTISGYSLSLAQFKDGTLLGIGYGEWSGELKIEVYEETESGVKSRAVFEENASFSTEYKAYFINKEQGLVGLAIRSYEHYTTDNEYLLLQYDGYNTFMERVRLPIDSHYNYTRAFLADGVFYIVGGEQLKAVKL